jgi:segregation and condensation protein A
VEQTERRNAQDKLVDIIEKPTWKSLLIETIQGESMDPWEIDVVLLTDKYLEKIRLMRDLSFRVPANAVLASAILVRFKSDAWAIFDEILPEEQDYEIDYSWFAEHVPELKAPKRVPTRKITLDELIKAVEDVMEKQKKRAKKMKAKNIVPNELLEMLDYDDEKEFQQQVDSVYGKILKTVDDTNLTCMSDLLEDTTRESVVTVLIPLLHLANDSRVAIWQEKYFEEIFVQLLQEGKNESGRESKAG